MSAAAEVRRESGAKKGGRCNRLCRPRLSLYEATCPRHGIRVLLDALTTPSCPAPVDPTPRPALGFRGHSEKGGT